MLLKAGLVVSQENEDPFNRKRIHGQCRVMSSNRLSSLRGGYSTN